LDMFDRTLELLKLEGLGFSQAKVVHEISQKIACSDRNIDNNFESQVEWQHFPQSAVKRHELLLVVNHYEQIYYGSGVRAFYQAPFFISEELKGVVFNG
jgi:hypothetical protein